MGLPESSSIRALIPHAVVIVLLVVGLILLIDIREATRIAPLPSASASTSSKPSTSDSSSWSSSLPLWSSSKLGVYKHTSVATDTWPCAQVASDIMERLAGTAVDAAIAALVCAGAVHPMSLGLGGGFVMTVYIASEKKSYSLLARERAPLNAHKNMFKDDKDSSLLGGLAVAVPGELRGYEEAKKRFGNPEISLKQLFLPTIKMCEQGIAISPSLAKVLRGEGELVRNSTSLAEMFVGKEEKMKGEGEIFHCLELAKTLNTIGDKGVEEFYNGQIGEKIVQAVKDSGGILSMEDLRQYSVLWDDALSVDLSEGWSAMSTQAPSGGPVVLGILNILSHLNISSNRADLNSYQRFVEALKFGYAKRNLLGDPKNEELKRNVTRVVETLLSSDWGQKVASLIRDDFTSQDASYYGPDLISSGTDAGTAHVSVLGPNGNAVAVTSTINTYFGSGLVVDGIVLNNEMDDFSRPGLSNVYGVAPSESNFVRAGSIPVSSMCPTIVMKDGEVRLVLGASGGPKIISSVAQVTMASIWMDMNIKDAIDEPRLHHQLLPMRVEHDPGVAEAILDHLKDIGHEVHEREGYARGSVVQALNILDSEIITANADWRKFGQIAGF